MNIPARDGDRCPECGTPLEPIELSGSPAEAVDEFVLRCANGHERRVHRDGQGTGGESTPAEPGQV